MHAYRDAIRRSAGAYVLYPGTDVPTKFQGFHELLPGLGAFPLRPGVSDDGSKYLSRFLKDVVAHVCNRTTHREQHSFHTYKIHNNPTPHEVHDVLPEKEYDGRERVKPPAEVFVLHGWHNGKEHLDWIEKSGYYNYRTEDKRGSLRLEESVANASYILLHGCGEYKQASRLYRITQCGPRVFSKEKLLENGYPGGAAQPFYIVYDIAPIDSTDPLSAYTWDLSKLDDVSDKRASPLPKRGIPLDVFMSAAKLKS